MTQVFDHLHISGYRGFEVVELSQLGQVNIFVGNNNSGKTSLLEVISILCNPLDLFQWLEVSQRRLYLGRTQIAFRPDLEAMKWIFPQKIGSYSSESYQGEILAKSSGSVPIRELNVKLSEIYSLVLEKSSQEKFDDDSTSSERDSVLAGVELNVSADLISGQSSLFTENEKEVFQFWEKERFVQRRRNKPLVKNATIFPSYSSSEPILDRLSQIILREADGKNMVLELLQPFDNNILDIQILSTPRATLYIKHRELGFAPLYVFGDGLKRALVMALTLLNTANGILLVDEIEISIYVSALSRIFSWLIETCRRLEIQLFVTTHSLEAIDAMLQPEIATDDVVAFRLNPKGVPQRFSGSLLHRLRSERGLDVR
jgi:predicted ATP-binding protein involved in virulence